MRNDNIMDHILLARATRKPYAESPEIEAGVRYDSEKGYWLSGAEPLVSTDNFLATDPTTKKCDVETGEDQKGE